MELRRLRYVVRVAEQGSMSRAALHLNVVQSAHPGRVNSLWKLGA